jgi:hypothetical protein
LGGIRSQVYNRIERSWLRSCNLFLRYSFDNSLPSSISSG